VRPDGKHLLIQMHRDDNIDTVARLTELARNRYSAAFRGHTGRWEPLPVDGDLQQAADAVTTLLAPYFDPLYVSASDRLPSNWVCKDGLTGRIRTRSARRSHIWRHTV